jgi:hypothetical protein
MKQEGPLLDSLLRRLADCPPEFLEASIDVVAIACDLLRDMDAANPPELMADWLSTLRRRTEPERKLTAVICWLFYDEWFVSRPPLAPRVGQVLASVSLMTLTELVRAEKFVQDPDRREELARVCLSELGLRPSGETVAQAADRLTTLDSRERSRVLRATAAAEKRAREIREAMARQKAQESASRYGE